MIQGTLSKSSNGKFVIHYEYRYNERNYFEEYKIHPCFKSYDGFMDGQQIKFIRAIECDVHYPDECDCVTNQMYAIIVDDKKKEKSWLKRLLSKLKKDDTKQCY